MWGRGSQSALLYLLLSCPCHSESFKQTRFISSWLVRLKKMKKLFQTNCTLHESPLVTINDRLWPCGILKPNYTVTATVKSKKMTHVLQKSLLLLQLSTELVCQICSEWSSVVIESKEPFPVFVWALCWWACLQIVSTFYQHTLCDAHLCWVQRTVSASDGNAALKVQSGAVQIKEKTAMSWWTMQLSAQKKSDILWDRKSVQYFCNTRGLMQEPQTDLREFVVFTNFLQLWISSKAQMKCMSGPVLSYDFFSSQGETFL